MPATIDDFLARLERAKGDPWAQSVLAAEYEIGARPDAERDRLQAALDAATVLRWFDLATLGHMLSLPQGEAQSVYGALTSLSSVETFQRRERSVHNVHESTRLSWRSRLYLENPGLFRRLSARAAAYFDEDTSDEGRIERAYHLLSADPERGADALEQLDRESDTSGHPENRVLLGAALRELAAGTAPGLEPAARAEVLLCLGKIRVGRGEDSEVEAMAREALALAGSAGRASAQGRALHLLGRALKALGNLDGALAAFNSGEAIFQHLIAQEPTSVSWQPDHSGSVSDLAGPGRWWSSSPVWRESIFVGREPELFELDRALGDVVAGVAVTVLVHGESGIGKSAFIDFFIRRLTEPVVLMGQCRESEAVPFNAIDGIVDALSRFLCRLPNAIAAELMPCNAALLPDVFPVLGRVPAIAKAQQPGQRAVDPFQQRKRVFTALREMFCLLTKRYRLICVIDDMQWVDSDSLALLEELLRSPGEPCMLFIAALRSYDEAPALPRLPGEMRRIRLQRLNPSESSTLAEALLDRVAPEQRTQSARIVDETGGHPLFIGELVRYAATDDRAATRQLRLDEVIWARVAQLDATAIDVLKIIAVAAAPFSEELIYTAARLKASEFQKCVAVLRVNHLIRACTTRDDAVVPKTPIGKLQRRTCRAPFSRRNARHDRDLFLGSPAPGSGDERRVTT